MILKPGTRLGPYEMVAQIGAGGMGVVWKALDSTLNRHVAIKFLPSDLISDDEWKLRFRREAQAAAALDHPNIAVIHQVGEQDDTPFIVMQLLEGRTLRQRIRERQLPLKEWLRVGAAMADGLAHAHDHGIIHRDLKPDNVMITSDKQVKILDFGLAKVFDPERLPTRPVGDSDEVSAELTLRGHVFGTVSYMSPEQARGEAMDHRSDLFSCGILLYEMASGRVPFKGDSAVETLGAIIAVEPPPLTELAEQIPEDAVRVVRKAMEKEPERRYQHAVELATDLRNLQRDLTSGRVAIQSGALRTAARTPRRLWRFFAPAAILLALAAVVGYFLWPSEPQTAAVGAGGRPAMTVMPFDNPVGSDDTRWLSQGIPNMLLTSLSQTPGLDVISSQRLHEVLAKMGHVDTDTVEKSQVLEVARRAGAGTVVAGSVFQVGAETRIDVQVEDVASGRVIFAHSVTGQEIFPLVDELSEQILDRLHLTMGPARSIADMTSGSLEAYRLYTDGLSVMGNMRYADAFDLHRQAIAIDPSFAMAFYELSSISAVVGDVAAERDYLQQAMEHLDRLPERERLLVQAQSARKLEVDLDEATALLEQLIEGYPDEVRAYEDLGVIYRDLNREKQAVLVYERGIAALPNSGRLRNMYAYMLIEVGRYAEALREFEAYARLEPDEPNPHDSFGEAYLIAGQPEKALARYAKALETDSSFWPSHRGRAWAQATVGNYDEALEELTQAEQIMVTSDLPRHQTQFTRAFYLSRIGRYREADREIARGIAAAEQVESMNGLAYLELLTALLALETGDDEGVRRAAGRARRIGPQIALELARDDVAVTAQLLLGLAELRTTRLEAARERLAAAGELYDRHSLLENWKYHCLEGELALAEGEPERARDAFTSGEPELKMYFGLHRPERTILANNLPCRDWQARLSEARGDLAGAARAYRELLEPASGRKWTAVLEPRYVLELGRVLEQMGDSEGARNAYERFLELWKDADASSPLVRQAREGDARLQ